MDDDYQQVTCKINHNDFVDEYIINFVYEKCKDLLIRPLRNKMIQRSDEKDTPLLIVGDYNVITCIKEKLGGGGEYPTI